MPDGTARGRAAVRARDDEDALARRARDAVAGLKLSEAVELGVGADFWRTKALPGIPALTLSDGPSGLRYQPAGANARVVTESAPATCFPALCTLAASWDPVLAERVGAAIGAEAVALGVGIVLGPGLNIKRSPLCGRNFEYLSEDPLLAGVMAAAQVRGIQSAGAGACAKHFAANSQEFQRFSSDSVIDERTLRELYLRAFEHVVRCARPEMVMSAYVKVNGSYCSDNRPLLNDILRGEWGFQGAVVSDWGGMHDRVAAYRAGCDLAMPGGTRHHQRHVRRALALGGLSEEDVRASSERLVRLALKHAPKRGAGGAPVAADVRAAERPALDAAAVAERRAVARRAAAEGHVLLANDGTLPLEPGASVALIGAFAAEPRYQGVGSSHVSARRVSTLRDEAPGWRYAAGYDPRDGSTTPALLAEAEQAARSADACVVVVGLPGSWEQEGFDRAGMEMPEGMRELVRRVTAASARCAVVIQSGSPVELSCARAAGAVLWAGLGGEAGAEASYQVLTGSADPSGRLAETWPLSAQDAPCMGWWGDPHRQAQYREGVFSGYRYYEAVGARVAFCFGHGLSYARFSYACARVEGDAVSFELANTGDRPGAEVAQVYAVPLGADAPFDGVPRPPVELAGFARCPLGRGERRRVRVELDPKSFSLWDNGWRLVPGPYELRIGASVRDIRLTCVLTVGEEGSGTDAGGAHAEEPAAAPAFAGLARLSRERAQELAERFAGTWYARPRPGYPTREDAKVLLGAEIPEDLPHGRGSFDETDTLEDLARSSRLCRLAVRLVRWFIERDYADPACPECRASVEGGVRSALFVLVNSSGGMFPETLARALVNLANGRAPWSRRKRAD